MILSTMRAFQAISVVKYQHALRTMLAWIVIPTVATHFRLYAIGQTGGAVSIQSAEYTLCSFYSSMTETSGSHE